MIDPHALPLIEQLFWVSAFGLIVGSFLNVVIYRVPIGRSVVTPRSQCQCGAPITWYDNIPVFSWILLRGKARCCRQTISLQYPLVEFLTATLFLVIWFEAASLGRALAGMCLFSGLIPIFIIDWRHTIIPDKILFGLIVLGLVCSVCFPEIHQVIGNGNGLKMALLGLGLGSGLIMWLVLSLEYLLGKDCMGFGDIKLVGVMGIYLGWKEAILTLFLAAVIGLGWAAVAYGVRKLGGSQLLPATRDDQPSEIGFGAYVPFGPMLALAGGLLWFFPLGTALINRL